MVEEGFAAALFVAGWIVFPGAFLIQRHLWFHTSFGSKLSKKYGLTDKDCADISNKMVSAFQAMLATIAGYIVCTNCYENVLYDAHPMTLIYAWFGIPYFFYDTLAMFYVSRMANKTPDSSNIVFEFIKFIIRSPVIVIHHLILAPLGFSLIAFFRDGVRNGDFFVGIIYLMETSTPFVSFRFILSKFKMKSSSLYRINGVLMLLFFPVFRIASCFYAVGLYAQQNGLGYFETIYNIPWPWKLVYSAAVAPQMYWYFLMWKGLIKMIRKSTAQKEDGDERSQGQELTSNDQVPRKNGVGNFGVLGRTPKLD